MEIRGAEAVVTTGRTVLKQRIRKSYRIDQLDEKIRKERTKKEAKLLSDAKRAGIKAPTILNVTKYSIEMEAIKGKTISKCLDSIKNWDEVCKKIGFSVAKLHESNIIHGDLTTSNMILSGNEVYFIDFGLGYESMRIEDRAVDLRVLEEALRAKHYRKWNEYLSSVIKGYSAYEKSGEVMKRLEKIRHRGRYL